MRATPVAVRQESPKSNVLPVDPLEAAAKTRAFESAYASHYRDVYRYVAVLAGAPDDVDDIVADTFERAFRTWSGDGGMPPRPVAWLLLTARRLVIDRSRRTRSRLRRAIGSNRQAGSAGEAQTEFWLWVSALSETLDARQREVLVLRYQRDLSDDEIARLMGLSASGVRSLVSRALGILRRHPELRT